MKINESALSGISELTRIEAQEKVVNENKLQAEELNVITTLFSNFFLVLLTR
jgi:hypothetical protein